MTKGSLLAAIAGAAIVATSPAHSESSRPNRPELGYFLPRARAAVRVDQLIRRCPSPEQHDPLVTSTASVVPRLGPDPDFLIRVDARSRFLSGRTTHLTLRPDGTLASFNATTEGQGGDVLSAAIGLASTVASFAVGLPPLAGPAKEQAMSTVEGPRPPPPPPPPFSCTPQTQRLVTRLAQVEQDLANLSSQVAEGAETETTAQVLEGLTTERAGLVSRLTLSTAPFIFNPQRSEFLSASGEVARAELVEVLAPIDYSPWFNRNDDPLRAWLQEQGVPGRFEFRAKLAPSRALLIALGAGDGSVPSALNPTPAGGAATPYLYYRRPVPASVAIVPCLSAETSDDCTPDESHPAAAASAQETVLFPQLSGLFSIPIGNGNIFGTRRAVAEFDDRGSPTRLEYGSTPGGAAIAGVINSGGTALTTLRDARTATITRRIEREKALAELNDLLDDTEPQASTD